MQMTGQVECKRVLKWSAISQPIPSTLFSIAYESEFAAPRIYETGVMLRTTRQWIACGLSDDATALIAF